MPADAVGERFLELTEHGEEAELRERLERIRRARGRGWTESRLMEAALRPAEATELESFSPLDGERLGAVPTITPEQVQAVVDDVASGAAVLGAAAARRTARATCAAPRR